MTDDFRINAEMNATAETIRWINSSRGPYKFDDKRTIEAGQVVSPAVLILSRALTDDERGGLKVQVLKIGSGLITDLEIAKGFGDSRSFDGHTWGYTQEAQLTDGPNGIYRHHPPKPYVIEAGQVVAGMTLVSTAVPMAKQLTTLVAQAKAIGNTVEEGLIADVIVPRGLVVDYGGEWKLSGKLRLDKIQTPEPE